MIPSTREPRPKRPDWRRIYLYEVFAAGLFIVTIVFLRASGMNVGAEAMRLTLPTWFVSLLTAFAYGIGIHLAWMAVAGVVAAVKQARVESEGGDRKRALWTPTVDYLRALVRPAWLIQTLRLLLALTAIFFLYMWLKVSIPLINHRLWDQQLWDLDAWLHFGVSPSIFAVALFEGTLLARVIDVWYSVWIWTSVFGLGFFCAFGDNDLRRRFVTSQCLVFGIGVWLYLSCPALGPVYINHRAWTEIRQDMPRARVLQDDLWENYQKVLKGRDGQLHEFNPNHGVAAMPSLHVAVHLLLTLWARRRLRRLYVFFALGTLLTFIGSVVTGWHYAVDGYVGAALGVFAYWVAVRGLPSVRQAAGPRGELEESPPTPGTPG